jgi:2-dehydro-3-deoxyphosphogluconate aldolase/(4S)-4-hydroxy-2-oxoglutarate aldolase
MNRSQVLESIRACGIVPAVRVETKVQVLRALKSLGEGGVQVAEIAMSMVGAAGLLDAALSEFGDSMIIGAGTVLDAETARACILSGASFIVSPALNPAIIKMCRKYSVAVFPGALTPTEILAAWTAGADCVKIFPANSVGGASYIRAIKVPLPQVEVLPMGGVSLETAADYIKAGALALGVGNDLVSIPYLHDPSGTPVSARAREYRSRIDDARKTL